MGYRLKEVQVILGKYKGIEILKQEIEDPKSELTEDMLKKKKQDIVVGKIIAGAKMDVPNEMIDKVGKQMAEEFASRLSQQGLSVDQYFDMTGTDPDKLLKRMLPIAEKRVKGRLVLEAVAKTENLLVTEEEYEGEIKRLSAMYLMSPEQIKKLVEGKEEKQIKIDIAIQKAAEFVLEQAVVK